MHVKENVVAIGVNDRQTDLFEGQFPIPNGIRYNSYLILDEKVAVMDSVDARFGEEWLQNMQAALNGRTPDYLIVQHMEPDHSASILLFARTWPDAVIVATDKAFRMMAQFYQNDFSNRRLIVNESSVLDLGKRRLRFLLAPMVHWPEVMMTYDETDRILFSADAFGKFGDDKADEDWDCEARRYYFGIVGKYGPPVQKVLAKAKTMAIDVICPLHGPVLSQGLDHYLNQYDIWSSYRAETLGVVVAYTSVYGNTERVALAIAKKLEEQGVKVALHDLARCDMSEAVEDAFRYDSMILATTTYNGGIFPFMHTFLNHLIERGYCKRRIGIVENGSWAPTAGSVINKMLAVCRDVQISENTVRILSAPDEECWQRVDALAEEFSTPIAQA